MTTATATRAAEVPDIERVRQALGAELDAVSALIADNLRSNVEFIGNAGAHLACGGGKLLRPMTALLAALALGYKGRKHITLGAVVELIHTATLLHDDVIDGAARRRGRETVNHLWGNHASVLVGDFLYSRAFQMIVRIDNPAVTACFADTTNTIAEGEIEQSLNRRRDSLDEDGYLEVIRKKTAVLFEAATRCGALVAEASPDALRSLSAYGLRLGMAFQIIDDVLDYAGDGDGKAPGKDLAEGKPTLPIIHAIANGAPDDAEFLRDALAGARGDQLARATAALRDAGSFDYARRLAEHHTRAACDALAGLPASPHREALLDLARLACARSH